MFAEQERDIHCSVLRVQGIQKKKKVAEESSLKFSLFTFFFERIVRPVGQAVKTAASHAANVGSIPARVTKCAFSSVGRATDS